MAHKRDRIKDENKVKVKINKDKEARTEEISEMIDEGGLGAEKYYDVKKVSSEEANSEKKDE